MSVITTPSQTWVLLRGLTRERRHWGAFPAALAAALTDSCADSRVVEIDLPGNGELNGEPSPWNIEAMVEHCRQALRQSALPPPYRVVAMSMGAMAATAWAARYPAEITAAVLINTSMRPFSPLHHRLLPRNYGSLLRLFLGNPTPTEIEEAVLRMTSHHHQGDTALRDTWAAYRRERPVSRINALAQLWAAARFRAPVERPFRQVMLMTSRLDALVDTQCSVALAAAWQCTLISHGFAGHDLPLDDPEWVVRHAVEWVSSIVPGNVTSPA
jgi:pimeloyl-ACP methyl ester carboxylesterase